MKFTLLILLSCFAVSNSWAQVIAEKNFEMDKSKNSEKYDGEVGVGFVPIGWPDSTAKPAVNELSFEKKSMTKWHKNSAEQYLVVTKGAGQVQFYNTGARLITYKLQEGSKVYIPALTCHRFGSESKPITLVHVNNGADQWDNCDKDFTPPE